MKNLIIETLKPFLKNVKYPDVDLWQVCSFNEYVKLAEDTVEGAIDLWGVFDYVIMFSDFPDYCFIQKEMTSDDIKNNIAAWIKNTIHQWNE